MRILWSIYSIIFLLGSTLSFNASDGVSKIRFEKPASFSLRSVFTPTVLTRAATDGFVCGALSARDSIWWFESDLQKGFRTGTFYCSTSLLDHLFNEEVFTFDQYGPLANYLSRSSAAYISSYTSFACFHGLSRATNMQSIHIANMISSVCMNTLYDDMYERVSRYMPDEAAHATATAALYAASNIIALPFVMRATHSNNVSAHINWIMNNIPFMAALGFAFGPYGVRFQHSF